MCLAIYKPAGAWASKARLRRAFKHNPNGAGFAWHDGSTVQVLKGFFTWRSFWRNFKQHVKSETPAFIHFRITTVGGSTAENCHPFRLTNGVLMHNGPCLNARHCAGDETRSDTRMFAEDFIDGLESWQVERIKPMIEDFAGTEKVAMMFDDGAVVIANEGNGHWADGCWWSNSSYEEPKWATSNLIGYRFNHYADIGGDTEFDPYDPMEQVEPRALGYVPRTGLLHWSEKLHRAVQKRVWFDNSNYTWDETLCAYLRGPVGPFVMIDDTIVYDQSTEDPTQMEEVGFVVASPEDYDDISAMLGAPRSLVAATQE